MEFLGHGMVGLNHPPTWASYFAVVGINRELAFRLMPVIGAMDIAIGALILVFPFRPLTLYMAIWGLWTALLRPLAGESIWEALERAGNYGAPYALFLVLGSGIGARRADNEMAASIGEPRRTVIDRVLWSTTVLLLLGHGALGLLLRKQLFAMQYTHMGWPGVLVEPWIGVFEIAFALAIIWRPDRRLLILVVLWKLATEALSPIAGSSVWVFVEHGGSYAAPLALALLSTPSRASQTAAVLSESPG